MSKIHDVNQRGIYTDLMRKFRDEGHHVYVVSPCERRDNQPTQVIESDGVHILSVLTLNVQKTNVIEKGLGQVSLEFLYKHAIRKHFSGIKFDLILYSTPPITLTKVIETVKRWDPQAISYLLLKDIFPQNAVDLCMLSKRGLKRFLYNSFRKKEKKIYAISDLIGCMSPANVKYVLEHNPEIIPGKVEVAPNSIELTTTLDGQHSTDITLLKKYNLPTDKPIFIYGGNLGKPQGIPFLILCLDANRQREDCHFLIVGDGTEYRKLQAWMSKTIPANMSLFNRLPKADYDCLVRNCDVGLIFLDHRFTIPNYPSRLLSYLEYRMPIIAATDPNTDIGRIAEENGYGYWCESNSIDAFTACIDKMLVSDFKAMGEKGYNFLLNNYQVKNTYKTIIEHIK